MPLRDHFRPPVDDFTSPDGLFVQWPGVIVQGLRNLLPDGFRAAPWFGTDTPVELEGSEQPESTWKPPPPNVLVEWQRGDPDEFEVQVFRGQRLVAAVEIVSPANKDRPEKRNDFIGKCAALLKQGVAVSIVDLVTVRHSNLYADLLEFVGHADADTTMGEHPPTIYAASCRWVERGKKTILETWSFTLAVGQPLPTLPLWLAPELVVPLNLEASYERVCHDLWIA